MIDHEDVQAALSAQLDGEPPGLDPDVVDAHVAVCAECRAYRDRAAEVAGSLRFVESPRSGMAPPRDLAETILASVEPAWRRQTSGRLAWLTVGRIAVLVLAVVHVFWGVSSIGDSGGLATVSPDGTVLDPAAQPETVQLLIESAGLHFALAVGLVFTAWRPRLIPGFIIVPATFTTFLLGFAARDLILGGVGAVEVGLLSILALTVLIPALTWIADRGVLLRRAWRTLSSDPQ